MKLFRRHQHRDLDERVEHARREAAESRRRLEETRTHVVRPLLARGARNQFAEDIRASLMGGNHDTA